MLFNLVRKDYILAKKYLLLVLVFAVGAPIFISLRTKVQGIGMLSFIMTVLMIQYMLYATIATEEDKYKGAALLCATSYTRSNLVESKYIFLLINFAINCTAYIISSYLVNGMEKLSMIDVGVSLLIFCIFFGISIPLQYKFGFEKVRYIFVTIIFVGPFIAPSILKYAEAHNINFNVLSGLSYSVQNMILYGFAAAIIYVSLIVSSHIYLNKNL